MSYHPLPTKHSTQINAELLDRYAQCPSGVEVIAAQNAYLAAAQKVPKSVAQPGDGYVSEALLPSMDDDDDDEEEEEEDDE